MKRMLLSALISASVLFGSNICGMTEKDPEMKSGTQSDAQFLFHCLPSDIINSTDPKEEEVEALYQKLCDLNNERIDNPGTVYEKYLTAFKQDSSSETTKEYSRLLSVMEAEQVKCIISEINAASRELTQQEQKVRDNLLKAFNLPLDKTEVRVIDAESRINGMYLNQARKKYYRSWISSKASIAPLVYEWADRTTFTPIKLRSEILPVLIENSQKSKIYRDLMIAYMAFTESIQPICSRFSLGKVMHEIYRGNMFSHTTRGIRIIDMNWGCITDTYFRGADTCVVRGKIFSELNSAKILFHEFGHALDTYTRMSDKFILGKTMEEVVPHFFDITVDTEALTKELKSKESIEELKKNMEKEPNFLQIWGETYGQKFDSLDDFLNYVCSNCYDPIVQAKTAINATPEAWQILGVSLLKNNDKYILYINKLSDFFLQLELWEPIRSTHLEITAEELTEADKQTEKSTTTHRLARQTYGVLMEFGGSSLCEYVLKLQYPFGISSLLKNEYRLNAPLKEYPIVRWQPSFVWPNFSVAH